MARLEERIGRREDRTNTEESSRLRQPLARHQRCVIHLHLRRRPLPSRPGSKGVVPSRGRAAPPRARMGSISESPRRGEQARTPLHTGYPRTASPATTPTNRTDMSIRTRIRRRHDQKMAIVVVKGQTKDLTDHHHNASGSTPLQTDHTHSTSTFRHPQGDAFKKEIVLGRHRRPIQRFEIFTQI